MGFHSFWDVYNQLRDVVDSEYLFQSSIGAVDQENALVGSNSDLPLHHLRPCRFGQDGIPALRHIERGGEAPYFPSLFPF